jgi:hypothetical protein
VPQVTIDISTEDIKKLKDIKNHAQFLHDALEYAEIIDYAKIKRFIKQLEPEQPTLL